MLGSVMPRLASIVGITERESRVGQLGWHESFNRKNISVFFLFCVTREKGKIS